MARWPRPVARQLKPRPQERTDVLSTLRVLIQIAFRNLFASGMKTLIVGGIVFSGALIVTVGGSLLDSVVSGMSRSIIGTLAGDIQVYSAQSKEDLALFGNMGG